MPYDNDVSPIYDRNSQWVRPGEHVYDTPLPPADETQFRDWVKQNNVPFDPNAGVTDYDMRGFWKGLTTNDPHIEYEVNPYDHKFHFGDYWKTPYHESFSRESQWATPDAPYWMGNQLIDQQGNQVYPAPGFADGGRIPHFADAGEVDETPDAPPPFDPGKPFAPAETAAPTAAAPPPFDPGKPFTAAPAFDPNKPFAAAPAAPQWTKQSPLAPKTQAEIDAAPVGSVVRHPKTGELFTKPPPAPELAQDTGEELDFSGLTAPPKAPGVFETAYEAGKKGFVSGIKESIQAPTAFRDRPAEEADTTPVGELLAAPISQGWNDPKWWVAHIVHGAAASSPSLAAGAAGAAAGAGIAGATTGIGAPVGALVGGAGGFALGSAIQTIAPAYQRARAAGLDHDESVNRALAETGIAAAFGGAMGAAPALSPLKGAVSRALAEIFAVQPGLGIGQQVATGAVEGKMPSLDELGTAYAEQAGMGAAMVGGHGAARRLLGHGAGAPATSPNPPPPPSTPGNVPAPGQTIGMPMGAAGVQPMTVARHQGDITILTDAEGNEHPMLAADVARMRTEAPSAPVEPTPAVETPPTPTPEPATATPAETAPVADPYAGYGERTQADLDREAEAERHVATQLSDQADAAQRAAVATGAPPTGGEIAQRLAVDEADATAPPPVLTPTPPAQQATPASPAIPRGIDPIDAARAAIGKIDPGSPITIGKLRSELGIKDPAAWQQLVSQLETEGLISAPDARRRRTVRPNEAETPTEPVSGGPAQPPPQPETPPQEVRAPEAPVSSPADPVVTAAEPPAQPERPAEAPQPEPEGQQPDPRPGTINHLMGDMAPQAAPPEGKAATAAPETQAPATSNPLHPHIIPEGTTVYRGAQEGNRDVSRDFPDGVYVSLDRPSAEQWGAVTDYSVVKEPRLLDLGADTPEVRAFLGEATGEPIESREDYLTASGDTFVQNLGVEQLRERGLDGYRLGHDAFLLGSLSDYAKPAQHAAAVETPRDPYAGHEIRDGKQVAYLAGPYKDDHAAALAAVTRAREVANRVDPFSEFDAFGTARADFDRPGTINHLMGDMGPQEAVAPPAPEPAARAPIVPPEERARLAAAHEAEIAKEQDEYEARADVQKWAAEGGDLVKARADKIARAMNAWHDGFDKGMRNEEVRDSMTPAGISRTDGWESAQELLYPTPPQAEMPRDPYAGYASHGIRDVEGTERAPVPAQRGPAFERPIEPLGDDPSSRAPVEGVRDSAGTIIPGTAGAPRWLLDTTTYGRQQLAIKAGYSPREAQRISKMGWPALEREPETVGRLDAAAVETPTNSDNLQQTPNEPKIIEGNHTKTGAPIVTVQLPDRVSKEDFNRLGSEAKRMGGYYSSFRGRGAIPGFIFKTREAADRFAQIVRGETEAPTRGTQHPEAITEQVEQAREETHPEPSPAQIEAGNYAKGRVSYHGIPFVMENAEGSIRRGVDANGRSWESELPADYGYISKTEGADGEHVDAYIGPDHDSQRAFIVDQVDADTGAFDEHKVMLGFANWRDAHNAYTDAFSDGRGAERIGNVTPMSLDELKGWLKNGDTKNPVAPAAKLENWLQSLPEDHRQQVYAAMRQVGELAQHEWQEAQRLEPPHGQLAAGSQGFDHVARAVGADGYLRALRRGVAPDDARASAAAEVAVAVATHNAKRPTDVNWRRDTAAESGFLDRVHGIIRRATSAEEQAPSSASGNAYDNVPRAPKRLLTWLVQNGGLRDDQGDIRHIIGGVRARPGLINNRAGMRLDDATLNAWQEGYLPGTERPDIQALLDAVDQDARGQAVYSKHDSFAAQAFETAMAHNSEVDRLGALYGIDPKGLSRETFWDRVAEHLSLDQAAEEATRLADAAEAEFSAAEERARQLVESRGDAWEPDLLYDQGHPRSLADLEDQYRQEAAAGAAAEGESGAGASESAGRGPGVVQEGAGPSGRGAGADGRNGEATGPQFSLETPNAPKARETLQPGFDLTDQGVQQVLPGAERSVLQAQRAREDAGRGKLRTTTPQQDAGGLFAEKAPEESGLPGLFETESPFFSALTRAVEAIPQPKAPGAQWANMIRNLTNRGVKQDEIDWSGVMDWLKDNPGLVTKDQVLDHLRSNEVRLEEVQRGTPTEAPDIAAKRERFQELADKASPSAWNRGERRSAAEDEEMSRLSDELMQHPNPWLDNSKESRYASYTSPGGENYRELLMTLPHSPRDTITPARLPAHERQEPYRHSHWVEPNVLAHVRMDDRTDAEGRKVLHVAEVQSDWHQAGRRKGYGGNWQVMDKDGATHSFVKTETDAHRVAGEIGGTYRRGFAVPNAPLKTQWPELAMKRVLRYAAEHGYDRVTWDTGETQAARYDLSKQIDYISYAKDGDGTWSVSARKGRDEVLGRRKQTADQIADSLGKDIADKITKGVGNEVGAPDGSGELRGLDLKVGGEGMRGFYDKMLPSFLNKYAKKWGAKVERGEIDARRRDAMGRVSSQGTAQQPVHAIDITPPMRESVMRGQALWEEPRGRAAAPTAIAPQYRDLAHAFAQHLQTNPDVHAASRDWLAASGRDTGFEHLTAIDNGAPREAYTFGNKTFVGFTPSLIQRAMDPDAGMVIHHNHPSGNSLSGQDYKQLMMPGIDTVVAHSHDGETFAARLTPEAKMWAAGEDAAQVGEHLEELRRAAEGEVYSQLFTRYEDGRVDRDAANMAYADLINRALDRGGVIDYMGSRDPASLVPDAERIIAAAGDRVQRAADQIGIPQPEDSDARLYRSAATVRPEESLSRLPRGDGEAAAAGPGRATGDATGTGIPRESQGLAEGERSLAAAVRVGDSRKGYQVYSGATHLDALAKVPQEQRGDATLDGHSRGYVTPRGRFLDRRQAQRYAVQNDLLTENAPAWAYDSPELISEFLKKPHGLADEIPRGIDEDPFDLAGQAEHATVEQAVGPPGAPKGPGWTRRFLNVMGAGPRSPGRGEHWFNVANRYVTAPSNAARYDMGGVSAQKWAAEEGKRNATARLRDSYVQKLQTWLGATPAEAKTLMAALELARLQGRDFPTDGRAIILQNAEARSDRAPLEHQPMAYHSRPGETVRLDSPQLIKMFGEIRTTMDKGWDDLTAATAKRYGWDGEPTSNAIRDAAAAADTPRERNRLEQTARMVGAIEYARRTAYVPFMRFGDYYFHVMPKEGTDGWEGEGHRPTSWFSLIDSRLPEEKVLGGRRGSSQTATAMRAEMERTFDPDQYEIREGYWHPTDDALREIGIPAIEKLFTLMGNDTEKLWRGRVKTAEVVPHPGGNGFAIRFPDGMGGFDYARAGARRNGDVLRWDSREAADVRSVAAEASELQERAIESLLNQVYEEMSAGFKKQARNVPGYSSDLTRSIGTYLNWLSGHIANIEHRDAIDSANMQVDRSYDPLARQFWHDTDAAQSREDTPLDGAMRTMRQATFYWALGLNASSTFKNLLDGPLIHMPVLTTGLGAQGRGFAAASYVNAAGAILKTMHIGKHGLDVDPVRGTRDAAERALLADAEALGITKPTGMEEIAAIRRSGVDALTPTQRFNRRALEIWGSNMAATDRLTRSAMLLSAYRTANRVGMDTINRVWGRDALWQHVEQKTPEAFAKFMVDRVAGIWGGANRIPAMRSPLGAAVGQFQLYSFNYLSIVHQLMTSMGPEGKASAALMLGGLSLVGGTLALPFAQDAEKAAEWVYRAVTGIDSDFSASLLRAMEGMGFDKEVGEIALHGVSRQALGFDLGSVGMGDVLSEFGRKEGLDAFGPAASILAGAPIKAIQRHQQGQSAAAVAAELMPSPVKALVKGLIVYPDEGVRTLRGGANAQVLTPGQIGTGERIAAAAGTLPTKLARAYEEREFERRAGEAAKRPSEALNKKVEGLLARAMYADNAGNRSEAAALRAEVDAAIRSAPAGARPNVQTINKALKQAIAPDVSAIRNAARTARPTIADSPYVRP